MNNKKKLAIGIFLLIIILLLTFIVNLKVNKENPTRIDNRIQEIYNYGKYLESKDIKPNTIVAKFNGQEILFREIGTARIQIDTAARNDEEKNKNAFYEVLKKKLYIEFAKKYADENNYDLHIENSLEKVKKEWLEGTQGKSLEEYRKEWLDILCIQEDQIWLNDDDFIKYLQTITIEQSLQGKGMDIIAKFMLDRPELANDKVLEDKVNTYKQLQENITSQEEMLSYMKDSYNLLSEIRDLYVEDLIKNANIEFLIDKEELSTSVPSIYYEYVVENKTSEKEIVNNVTEENNVIKTNSKEEAKNARIEFEKNYNEGVKSLDETVFVKDFDNYKPESSEVKISEEKAKQIAQKGFEESAKRIAGEGADNKDSETIKIEDTFANNYFTRYIYDGDKVYTNIKRKCYVVTRENDMGNGIKILVDVTTGLIIGGGAFGD